MTSNIIDNNYLTRTEDYEMEKIVCFWKHVFWTNRKYYEIGRLKIKLFRKNNKNRAFGSIYLLLLLLIYL